MPIYDYTYQTWKGERRGAIYRWLAIPKFTYLDYLGNRAFVSLLWVAWLPFLLFLGYIYLEVNTEFLKQFDPRLSLPPVTPIFFKVFIDIQIFFCVAFAFVLGANLISRDLAHNALVLYVSKPISRWEYFVGKFSVIFSISLLLTWCQSVVLLLLQVAVSDPESPWRTQLWQQSGSVLVAITLYCLVIAASLSLLIMAASSLVKNGKVAGLIFAIYLIGTYIMGNIVSEITEMNDLLAISPWAAIKSLGYALFKLQENMLITSQTSCWIGILCTWALCGLIIQWRMANAAKFGR